MAIFFREALPAWEWPLRWWKTLHDRDYGTHVSSADLVRLTLRRLGVGIT
jgi:hypothetical protein